jgi:hypothetical protein
VQSGTVKYRIFINAPHIFISVNLNKIISWFLLIILAPYIAQQLIILIQDPWAIKPTYFLFFTGPEFHNLTILILAVETLILWLSSKIKSTFERIEAVAIRLFCSVGFYEVIWHLGNGIKLGSIYVFYWHWWLIESSLLNYVGLLTVLSIALLVIHNKIYKIKPRNIKVFSILLTLFILTFLVQGYMGLDWSPLAIRYNLPVLWALTKIIGYGMWVFI